MRSRGTAAALLLGAGATCCSSFHTSHLQGFKRRRRLGRGYGAHRSAVPGSDADSAQGGMAGVAVVEPDLLLRDPTPAVPSDDTNVDNVSTTTPYASDLLFLRKPPGLLTLPGIGPDKADCLASRTNEWLRTTEEGRRQMAMVRAETDGEKKKRNKKKKKPHVPRPCHRLDHDTSGVVVMALTPHAQRCGQMAFEGRRTDKTYVALVAGHVVDDKGAVEYAIGKVPDESGEYNRWACDCDVASGGDGEQVEHLQFIEGSLRAARTEWRVCARLEGEAESPSAAGGGAKYTRVELKLVTGRGHQLRLHMAAIGHPILGDELHAPREVADAAPRLCLHAETLRMPVLSDDQEVMWASATYPAPF